MSLHKHVYLCSLSLSQSSLNTSWLSYLRDQGSSKVGEVLDLEDLKTFQDQSPVSNLLVHFCLSSHMVCANCLLTESEVVVMMVEMAEVEVVDVAIW